MDAAVLLCALLFGGDSAASEYSKAYHRSLKTDVPLVVLVGAEWCPACVRQKKVIATLDREKWSVALIEYDAAPAFARKFMRGNSIPQIIVYRKSGDVLRESWRGVAWEE